MIPGGLGGRAYWDRGEYNLYVALNKLLDGEVVIFGPMRGFGQPHTFL